MHTETAPQVLCLQSYLRYSTDVNNGQAQARITLEDGIKHIFVEVQAILNSIARAGIPRNHERLSHMVKPMSDIEEYS